MPYFEADANTHINVEAPMSVEVSGDTVTWNSPTSPSANVSVTYADNAAAITARNAFVALANDYLLYASMLGGWFSQPSVKGGIEALKRNGFTQEAAFRTVTNQMRVAAQEAGQET